MRRTVTKPAAKTILMRAVSAMIAGGTLLLTLLVTTAPDTGHAAEDRALGDIFFKGSGKRLQLPPAVFEHWKHRQRYRCSVCHEKLFVSKAGANLATMKELIDGKYCGACHNGKEAFNIEFASCTRCHQEYKGPSTQGAADTTDKGK